MADIIISNLLEGARAIVMATFDGTIGDGLTAEDSLAAAAVINGVEASEKTLRPDVVHALKTLWKDSKFQQAVELRS